MYELYIPGIQNSIELAILRCNNPSISFANCKEHRNIIFKQDYHITYWPEKSFTACLYAFLHALNACPDAILLKIIKIVP